MPNLGTIMWLVTGVGIATGVAYWVSHPTRNDPTTDPLSNKATSTLSLDLDKSDEDDNDQDNDEDTPTEETPDLPIQPETHGDQGGLDSVLEELERIMGLASNESTDIENLTERLTSYSPNAIETLVTFLEGDNQNNQMQFLDRRLIAIDALGLIALERPDVLARLRRYSTSPMRRNKDKKLLQYDLMDRLAVFEFCAGNEPEFAKEYIRQVKDPEFRAQLIERYAIGLRMNAIPESTIRREVQVLTLSP